MASIFLKRTLLFLLLFVAGSVYGQGPVTETVSVSATVGEEVTVTPSGGGGFGVPETAVRFSGEAYPNALVTLLKGGEEEARVTATAEGKFFLTLEEDTDAHYLYSLFAEDLRGNRSLLINYPLVVKTGYLTHLSGIRFPPTIVTDKIEAKFGDFLTVEGYALPGREMEISLDGPRKIIFSLTSSESGTYKIVLPLSKLPRGEYVVLIRYQGDLRASKLVKLSIGELNIFQPESLRNIPGDCNSDAVINLVDFSVLAFWYGRSNPPACVDTNEDGKINLTDFSILAFYWTG